MTRAGEPKHMPKVHLLAFFYARSSCAVRIEDATMPELRKRRRAAVQQANRYIKFSSGATLRQLPRLLGPAY